MTTRINKNRLSAFARKLSSLMLDKGWSGAQLAREATKQAPKGVQIGRHLISAYVRGANEPTDANLNYIAKALGVRPEDLLPPDDGGVPHAMAVTDLSGKTHLTVDALVDSDTAQKVLALVRADVINQGDRQ